MSGGVGGRSSADFTGLGRALRERLGRDPESLLVLTRSDLEPGLALRDAFPKADTMLLAKSDVQGLGRGAVLRRLRARRVDVFVLHDRAGEMRRLRDLYQLVALLTRARRRFLLASEPAGGPGPGWTLTSVSALRFLPGLLARLLIEAVAIPFLLLRSRLGLPGSRRPGDRRSPPVDRPLDIAFLRTDFSFDVTAGGSVSHIAGVRSGFLDLGHRITFFSSDRLAGVDASRTPVHVIPPSDRIRLFDAAAIVAYHHRFLKSCLSLLRSRAPDLIYQRHSVFNAAGGILARRLGIPLVLEANHSEVAARAMWSRLLLRGLAERFERCAFRNADAIIAVSRNGAEALRAHGADPARILVNPNGVNEARFHPGIDGSELRSRLGFAPQDVVCGFVSTFTRWHGTLFLAGAVGEAVTRHPDLRFLCVGDGDLRSALETDLERRGLGRFATFTGLIDHADVPLHLAACDFYIAPNLPLEDGTPFFMSPVKLFEYMAMGRATVAADLGQIPEVIADGENGLLFEAGSTESFLAAIGRIVAEPGLRAALGARARRTVLERYTWRHNAERTLAFLMERAGAAPSREAAGSTAGVSGG